MKPLIFCRKILNPFRMVYHNFCNLQSCPECGPLTKKPCKPLWSSSSYPIPNYTSDFEIPSLIPSEGPSKIRQSVYLKGDSIHKYVLSSHDHIPDFLPQRSFHAVSPDTHIEINSFLAHAFESGINRNGKFPCVSIQHYNSNLFGSLSANTHRQNKSKNVENSGPRWTQTGPSGTYTSYQGYSHNNAFRSAIEVEHVEAAPLTQRPYIRSISTDITSPIVAHPYQIQPVETKLVVPFNENFNLCLDITCTHDKVQSLRLSFVRPPGFQEIKIYNEKGPEFQIKKHPACVCAPPAPLTIAIEPNIKNRLRNKSKPQPEGLEITIETLEAALKALPDILNSPSDLLVSNYFPLVPSCNYFIKNNENKVGIIQVFKDDLLIFLENKSIIHHQLKPSPSSNLDIGSTVLDENRSLAPHRYVGGYKIYSPTKIEETDLPFLEFDSFVIPSFKELGFYVPHLTGEQTVKVDGRVRHLYPAPKTGLSRLPVVRQLPLNIGHKKYHYLIECMDQALANQKIKNYLHFMVHKKHLLFNPALQSAAAAI